MDVGLSHEIFKQSIALIGKKVIPLGQKKMGV